MYLTKGKSVPETYFEYIYNGNCYDTQEGIDLQIWADMNDIDLEMN